MCKLFDEHSGQAQLLLIGGIEQLLAIAIPDIETITQFDAVAFTRGKIEPMVRGLFPRAEQELVLSALAGSVVFLANTNIEVCANAEPRVPRGDFEHVVAEQRQIHELSSI